MAGYTFGTTKTGEFLTSKCSDGASVIWHQLRRSDEIFELATQVPGPSLAPQRTVSDLIIRPRQSRRQPRDGDRKSCLLRTEGILREAGLAY